MKVPFVLALTVALGWLAADARSQQKQPEDKKEKLEQLTEKLEGANIRLQMAKVKVRLAQADGKATKELLAVYDDRLKIYEGNDSAKGKISEEEYMNWRLAQHKCYQEAIQKEGAVELGQLEVQYRTWQVQRLERAIQRLKAPEKK